ncbi:hsp90 co-chaperone Cdc37 [Physocladia obscura]|uniref:Hsp90 co-chaperone Cdc37 n=1 Tax=Physocladia obscura TaxID=109957 RepID=A0AAD5TAV5_9FUNG|nr:hsp90 co-chaperone Cdc37 [Physocladia obscura]
MIRWKQAEVHRKRRVRADKMAALSLETQFNKDFIAALGTLNLANAQSISLQFAEKDRQLAHDVMVLAHRDLDPRWQAPVADPFFMKRVDISAALSRISAAVAENADLSVLATALISTFNERNSAIEIEIKNEQAEIDSKITSETIKEGFSKSIVSKEPSVISEPSKTKKKTVKSTETEVIALNNPVPASTVDTSKVFFIDIQNYFNISKRDHGQQAALSAEPQPTVVTDSNNDDEGDDEDDRVTITDPNVRTFAALTSAEASYKFISTHSYILAEKYHDQILAAAFDSAMKGDFAQTKICVHQSLLLQYCKLLGKDGVRLFFDRLAQHPAHKARDAFIKDVEDTFARIRARVAVLKKQEAEEADAEKKEGEKRAAAALQEDGTYKLPVSDNADEEEVKRAQVFSQLPTKLQRALLTQDVDEINEFLSASSKEDTEKYIELASSVGLISLSTDEDE